jgi:uncharacterized protein (UPF0332 family)
MKKGKENPEDEFVKWKAQHERLQHLFSAEALSSKVYLRRRIDSLKEIERNFRNVSETGSRLALKAISAERRLLENRLYKSRILRIFAGLFFAVKSLVTESRQRLASTPVIATAMPRRMNTTAGIDAPTARLLSAARSNSAVKTYKISDDEIAKVDMTFAKDQSGYSYKNYMVRHPTADGGIKEHSFRIPDGMIVSSRQAYNLVCGRACQTNDGSWLSLDINDKDRNGNYPLKVYGKDHGFDVSDALKGQPIKELKDEVDRRRIISDLQKGEPVSATYMQNGKRKTITLEANPKIKSVRKIGVNERPLRQKKSAKVININRANAPKLRG